MLLGAECRRTIASAPVRSRHAHRRSARSPCANRFAHLHPPRRYGREVRRRCGSASASRSTSAIRASAPGISGRTGRATERSRPPTIVWSLPVTSMPMAQPYAAPPTSTAGRGARPRRVNASRRCRRGRGTTRAPDRAGTAGATPTTHRSPARRAAARAGAAGTARRAARAGSAER